MSTSAATPLAFIGREPIYDRRLKVYGYELRFRLSADAATAEIGNGESCTARIVVNTFVDVGLENIVGSSLAFINVNRASIVGGFLRDLPKDRVVLDVMDTVVPDSEVMAALRKLKAEGYKIALGNFVYRDEVAPLLDVASIVKLDIRQLRADQLPWHLRMVRARGLSAAAERVETYDDMQACQDVGFDLFQGYFLAKPTTRQRRRAPDSNRLAALQVLSVLSAPNATTDELENAISGDVTLSYRLLCVINSAAFGIAWRITSLRQAIIHLGRSRIRSWVSMFVLSGLSNKPSDLLVTGLVRARMCERMGELLGAEEAHAFFTAGLFSILDIVLDTPMEQLLASLPLASAITDALLGRGGQVAAVLETAIAYERCEWVAAECEGLNAAQIRNAYLGAVRWSIETSRTAVV